MLVTRTNTTGIDIPIQALQTQLHTNLEAKWGVSLQSWGRAYRNRREGGYTAEVYAGSNEYAEVFWDDTFNACSFFSVGQRTSVNIEHEADVSMIWFVNLSKVAPAETDRADEQIRMDVVNEFVYLPLGWEYHGIETGIENVLKEFPVVRERLTHVDMHPVHCFRVNLSVRYNKFLNA